MKRTGVTTELAEASVTLPVRIGSLRVLRALRGMFLKYRSQHKKRRNLLGSATLVLPKFKI